MFKKKNVTYETCYKHKLNMLEPGIFMMQCSGSFLLGGTLLYFVGSYILAKILFTLAGAVFAVLLILVAVESHQDKVLNDLAAQEQLQKEKHEPH